VLTGYNVVTDYTFSISDSFEKSTTSNRVFEETLSIQDSYTKTFNKTFNESLPIQVSYIQNSLAVIYDITVRSASSYDLRDIRDFARQSQVAGYEPGVEFLPGDYDFKEAIVGLVLTNTTGSKIGFKEIDMYTDTPDVVDRGTVEITNSGPNYDSTDGYTTVYLNKEYHFVPNVTATVVSGTTLAEPFFDPDGFTNTSFRVKLIESAGGGTVSGSTLIVGGGSTTQVTGTLLWKAVGY